MSELAKSHIEIIDESSYGAGTSAIIPFYVFATEQDKIIDEETGEIAPGTTKSVAGEVIMLTSRKDVTDTYGVPQFTTVNGTVQQGDELNEVGLYGLYDALGNSSLAYAIRADIDLKQLKATDAEPKGKVANQTLWFDMDTDVTSYGLFRANGEKNGWIRIENVLVPSEDEIFDGKPLESYAGKDNSDNVAVVYDDGLKFFEKMSDSSWCLIGSDDWKEQLSEDAQMFFSSHTKVPSSEVAGSIWMKTTEPNFGAKIIMKQYVSSSDSWVSTTVPVYGSFVDAEHSYGPMLNAGSKVLKYESDGKAELKFYQFGSNGLKVTGTVENPTITEGDKFTVRVVDGGAIVTKTITASGTTVRDLVKDFNKEGLSSLVADVTSEGYFRIISSNGYSFELLNKDESTILDDLGIEEGEVSKWAEFDFEASKFEPTTDADEGTLWFNDKLNVDIMVNDGDEWKGYHNVYPDCEIFTTSEEPLQHSDGSVLCENDLWINTAAVDYPELYRYYDYKWVLVDNSDQTTPFGIVFADARENAGPEYTGSTHNPFSTDEDDLLVSDYVDPNTVNPQSYPAGLLLFNTMLSGNNVKEFKDVYANAVKEIGSTFTVGGSVEFATPGSADNEKTTRWVSASGNATDGSGLFGRKAQRAMVVKALAAAINANEDIRSNEYDFFYACCPGYPELDDELVKLNTEKKEMFYIVSDTPARLKAKANDITAWATNKNNASSHGEGGRIIQSAYMTRQYPPMGLTSNVDGAEITVPTSIAKMKNLLLLPRGMFAAGTQYGQVKNLASVGYISDEEEYTPVTVREGLGEVIVANKMNPIMPQRNTGLLFWGENTENNITSSLSDEHAILTLLRLKRELDEACLPFFFRPNTEALRKDFDATLRSILNDYVGREELYDYVLVTDRSVNTNERIERKELWAEIAIEIVKGVEQIYIPIRIVKTGSLSNSNI